MDMNMFRTAACFLAKQADDHLETSVDNRFLILLKKRDSDFAKFASKLPFDRQDMLITAANRRLATARFNPED